MSMNSERDPRSEHLKKLLPSLVLNVAVPFVAYLVVRPFTGSDLIALLVGVTIPVLVTVVGFAVRRRVDKIGLVSIVAFGLLIGLLAVTGGNPLILKLHEAVFTGPIGLLAVLSVPFGKPIAGLIPPLRAALPRRQLGTLTLLAGAILVLHALVVLAFALALPTATFLAVGRPIGIVVIAAGVLGLRAYMSHLKTAKVLAAPVS